MLHVSATRCSATTSAMVATAVRLWTLREPMPLPVRLTDALRIATIISAMIATAGQILQRRLRDTLQRHCHLRGGSALALLAIP